MKQSRGVEAEVVALIGEVELRRLYAREACSSLFEYCRRVLGLRENEAYLRITVARAARENPALLEFHHKRPFARGGDHSPTNLALMCRTHNTLVAGQDYGQDVMARFRAVASSCTSVPVDAYGARIVVRPRRLSSG